MIRLKLVIHAKAANDMAGNPGADRAVRILHCIAQLHFFAFLQETRGVAHNLGIQRVQNSVARFVAVIDDFGCTIDGDQQRVEIQIVKVGRPTADLRQQIGTANHVIQTTRPDRGEQFAHFGCIERDEVHDLIRVAGKLAPQRFVLGTDADGAGVRLALTHHDTAHSDQRRSTDAVFLGPHHRGHHDIAARAQPAVGPQGHAVTQVVHRQNLMRFGQPHFPRKPCIFDRGRRRRAGTTVVARDQDDIRLGLRHTRRNRANARGRHQLHGDLATRVDLLEVIDQLRQIFDGIDIVVRRGRDQRYPLGRMAQTGDQVGDLHTGQLATLAGLGPLGDLDLKFFALVQIFGSDTETTRSNLLDLGRRVIPV